MGETTAAIAAAQPDVDFIGVEMHLPGVGALLRRIDARASRTCASCATMPSTSSRMIAHGSLAGIHVYFPDPWPKKRHHKRRLLQAAVRARACERLATGGYLHVATDWQPYAEEILAVLAAEPLLANTCRRLRAASGVAAADEVRAARHRARPRGVRPAVHEASGLEPSARPRSAYNAIPVRRVRDPRAAAQRCRATSREKWRSMLAARPSDKPLPQRLVVVGAQHGFGERARHRRRPARRHRRSGACPRSTSDVATTGNP